MSAPAVAATTSAVAAHAATSVAAAAADEPAAHTSPSRGFARRMVLPGDAVTAELLAHAGAAPLRLGPGLAQAPGGAEAVLATRGGLLGHRPPQRFAVAASVRRYAPAVGDTVVGTVVDRATDFYRVRLHGTGVAQLPLLAFDGATKRNKPNLAVGATVFARVAAVSRHLDPELTCQAGGGAPKKDWMTGQSVYGELRGGTVLRVSTGLAARLLDPDCAILTALGGGVPFELAVGLNGAVWLQAGSGESRASGGGWGWRVRALRACRRARAR